MNRHNWTGKVQLWRFMYVEFVSVKALRQGAMSFRPSVYCSLAKSQFKLAHPVLNLTTSPFFQLPDHHAGKCEVGQFIMALKDRFPNKMANHYNMPQMDTARRNRRKRYMKPNSHQTRICLLCSEGRYATATGTAALMRDHLLEVHELEFTNPTHGSSSAYYLVVDSWKLLRTFDDKGRRRIVQAANTDVLNNPRCGLLNTIDLLDVGVNEVREKFAALKGDGEMKEWKRLALARRNLLDALPDMLTHAAALDRSRFLEWVKRTGVMPAIPKGRACSQGSRPASESYASAQRTVTCRSSGNISSAGRPMAGTRRPE